MKTRNKEILYNWNLNHLFHNDEEWNNTVNELEILITKFNTEFDKTDTNILLSLLENIKILIEKIFCYPRRFLDLNYADESKKIMLDKAKSLVKITNACEHRLQNYIINSHNIKYKAKYKHYVENLLRNKNHLTNNIESYTDLQQGLFKYKDHYQILIQNLIFDNICGDSIVVNFTEYPKLMLYDDAVIRKAAYLSFTNGFIDIGSELATLYSKILTSEMKLSKLDNYDSYIDKKLTVDELPTNLINNLLCEIKKEVYLVDQFVKLKKSEFNLTEYYPYDSMVNYNIFKDKKYTLEEGIDIVKNSLSILGKRYLNIINQAFEEGWLDLYSQKNKRKDSYSSIMYTAVPYTSVNYNSSLNFIKSLAHELGHAVNTKLARKQGVLYYEYSFFTAEIASNVNVLLFNDYMINNTADIELKKAVLFNEITNLNNVIFFEAQITDFELKVLAIKEKNQDLTENELNNLFKESYEIYNGKTTIINDEIKYAWMKTYHLFAHESLYCYQYITGLFIAITIVKNILCNKEYIPKYLKFLSVGNSKNITDSLKELNIDLNNTEYIKDSFIYLKEKINLLEHLTKNKE